MAKKWKKEIESSENYIIRFHFVAVVVIVNYYIIQIFFSVVPSSSVLGYHMRLIEQSDVEYIIKCLPTLYVFQTAHVLKTIV